MVEHEPASLEKKVGQLFFVGISGPDIDENTAALLSEVSPGGVCLFGRNIKSREQTSELLEGLAKALPQPLLSVDQEGGLVDRLKRILPAMPAASRLTSSDQAEEQGRLMGEAMRQLGFNMDFAPVVDVMCGDRGASGNGLCSRTYGTSADESAEFAEAFINGLQKEGILDCIKHFPGLGASHVDSHEELPLVEVQSEELASVDLLPYRRLIAKANAVMVAHAAFPHHPMQEKDSDGRMLPSSLSRNFVTRILREKLKFGGLVVTDDLEMGAIMRNYGIGDAAKTAIGAGVDMLAICADPENVRTAFRAVLAALNKGEISIERIEESLHRIASTKESIGPTPAFDSSRLDNISSKMSAFAERIANP